MSGQLPTKAGWYADPYHLGQKRWFDGSQWTTHAVSADVENADATVERHFDPRTDDERRTEDWQNQFPLWDAAVPRRGEPGFDGAGGAGGFVIQQQARVASSVAARVRHPARIGTMIVLLFLGYLAWGDPTHRSFLLGALGIFAVIAVVLEVRWAREKAHWDRVGQGTTEPL